MSRNQHRIAASRLAAVVFGATLVAASAGIATAAGDTAAAGNATSAGEPTAIFMPVRGSHGPFGGGGSSPLSYHGGNPGVITGGNKVYLVYWGSQWNSGDPSGEAAIQKSFFSGVGGSSWNNSVTQYCIGITTGTSNCSNAKTFASNPSGVWAASISDTASLAPAHPKQSQLAAEAVNVATDLLSKNTIGVADLSHVQFVINTASGNNSSGFGTRFCAWHSSTSFTYNGSGYTIAYTNMPYITDAGASCGANFNGLGANAGITIVGGHEFGETETDIFPSGGWLDGSGAENGDKCAWISSGQGAAADTTLSTGTFPVQSLWSNAFNSGTGGCVLSYP